MNLRRMGPLATDHPVVTNGTVCPFCKSGFEAGHYVTLWSTVPADDDEAEKARLGAARRTRPKPRSAIGSACRSSKALDFNSFVCYRLTLLAACSALPTRKGDEMLSIFRDNGSIDWSVRETPAYKRHVEREWQKTLAKATPSERAHFLRYDLGLQLSRAAGLDEYSVMLFMRDSDAWKSEQDVRDALARFAS
jgi:hypothetical protein